MNICDNTDVITSTGSIAGFYNGLQLWKIVHMCVWITLLAINHVGIDQFSRNVEMFLEQVPLIWVPKIVIQERVFKESLNRFFSQFNLDFNIYFHKAFFQIFVQEILLFHDMFWTNILIFTYIFVFVVVERSPFMYVLLLISLPYDNLKIVSV